MPKKKIGKHLQFYRAYIVGKQLLPCAGLCACSWNDYIDQNTLELFKPEYASIFSYWASGNKTSSYFKFTELRQTIVLFMAAINNEL